MVLPGRIPPPLSLCWRFHSSNWGYSRSRELGPNPVLWPLPTMTSFYHIQCPYLQSTHGNGIKPCELLATRHRSWLLDSRCLKKRGDESTPGERLTGLLHFHLSPAGGASNNVIWDLTQNIVPSKREPSSAQQRPLGAGGGTSYYGNDNYSHDLPTTTAILFLQNGMKRRNFFLFAEECNSRQEYNFSFRLICLFVGPLPGIWRFPG